MIALNPSSTPSFAAQFDRPLPRDLREEANSLSPNEFHSRYAPTSGPLRLGHWECADADLPAARLGVLARTYQATIAVGDRIGTSTAAAHGPIAALTAMLYERGVGVEMREFHQLHAGAATATFIRGTDGAREEWAVGWSDDPSSRRCAR